MADRAEKTFMVESYVPQLDARTATMRTASLCAAVRRLNEADIAVRLLRSLALIDEETHLCIVAAQDLAESSSSTSKRASSTTM